MVSGKGLAGLLADKGELLEAQELSGALRRRMSRLQLSPGLAGGSACADDAQVRLREALEDDSEGRAVGLAPFAQFAVVRGSWLIGERRLRRRSALDEVPVAGSDNLRTDGLGPLDIVRFTEDDRRNRSGHRGRIV